MSRDNDPPPEDPASSPRDSEAPDGEPEPAGLHGRDHGLQSSCDLQLQNPNGYPEASARRLRPWLEALLLSLAPSARSFVVRFTSDRELQRLNRSYRDKDKATDVLSFPGDASAQGKPGLEDSEHGAGEQEPWPWPADEAAAWEVAAESAGHLGDVVISVPTARRQASRHGHSSEHELRILVLHGLLHCLGYDHETDDGTMERLEQQLRARWLGPQSVIGSEADTLMASAKSRRAASAATDGQGGLEGMGHG